MHYIIPISIFITFLYFIVIFLFWYGWEKQKLFVNENKKTDLKVKISVIIACRNEEKNVSDLITFLQNQSYLTDYFEVILIDDHSTDNTKAKIQSSINFLKNFKFFQLPQNKTGKKAAIHYGIENSTGEIIVTTDADCIFHKEWLKTIANFYAETNADFISAPVEMIAGKTLFSKFQALEFMSLIATGAGAIAIKKPIMCNGANLIYRKSVYLENQKGLRNSSASGDDIFLLLAVKRKKNYKISFLKATAAIVKTHTQPTLSAFIQQRKRWTAKTKFYFDFDILAVAIIVFLMNFAIVASFCFGFFQKEFFLLFLTLFLLKSIPDFFILRSATNFFNRKEFLVFFPIFQFFYFFYVSFVAILGSLSSFNWKNRKYKS